MHKQTLRAVVLLAILLIAGSGSALTITADPADPFVGDRVRLSGTTENKNTIAVYLLVTGPGLDKKGVTLENLNLPAGMGYFTSAHVAHDGSFAYDWNTAFLAGNLEPGTYEVYVMSVPLNLARIGDSEKAKTDITFSAPEKEVNIGASPLASIAALPLALFLFISLSRRERKDQVHGSA